VDTGQYAPDHLQPTVNTPHAWLLGSSQCKILNLYSFSLSSRAYWLIGKNLECHNDEVSWVGYIRPWYFPSFRGGSIQMGANRLDQNLTGRLLTSNCKVLLWKRGILFTPSIQVPTRDPQPERGRLLRAWPILPCSSNGCWLKN
jgi:hypothetical protein